MSSSPKTTTTSVIRYHHLAVVCSDLNRSREFYHKVGFFEKNNGEEALSCMILANEGGLELHLFQSSRSNAPIQNNILIDFPDEKFPGHTHMSFGVGSVPGVKAYFKEQNIPLSGTREIPGKGLVAVFVRDPDGTVLELERNDGGDDGAVVTSKGLSNAPRGGIDHIGTRVSNPEVSLQWYVRAFGFRESVMKNELDEDPKKNFRPWIIRTQRGEDDIDINLIVNAPTSGENVLLSSKDDPLPGILYAAYVVESIESALQSIDPRDVARTESDLKAWGISSKYYLSSVDLNSCCFVRDLDKNIFRLVEL
jgi:catechol 2,3-dioxygenase-like lactoylglutathione lyase family enzyme